MPFFEEFPSDRVVNVHWHKKKPPDDGGEDDLPCGAFRHGYGLWNESPPGSGYLNFPNQSIFYLTFGNVYGLGLVFPASPGSLKTNAYWWSTADFQPQPIHRKDVPWIWGAPKSWTLTVDQAELDRRIKLTNPTRGYSVVSIYIEEIRNINPQRLPDYAYGDTLVPDRVVETNTIEILYQQDGEVYPPGFRVGMVLDSPSGQIRLRSIYPPTLIQAHCKNQTTGGLPDTDLHPVYDDVAPGSTAWPLRPPPPLPFS